MALPLNNNFEGGSNGTAITAGNSGGASGSAFDSVVSGSGTTQAFSTAQSAHGTVSGKFQTGSTSASAYVSWHSSIGGGQATLYGRVYLYLTGNVVSGGSRLVEFFSGGDNGTYLGGIAFNPGTPDLAIQDSTFTYKYVFSNTLSLNTWYRIEYEYQFQAGSATVKLFSGDSTSAIETKTQTGNFGGGSALCDTVDMGWAFSASNQPALYLDDLNVNSTGFPGPANSGPTSTGSFALAPLAFAASGTASENLVGSFALAPLAFAANGGPIVPVTSTGAFALAPIGFTNSATVSFPFPQFTLGVKTEILINGAWTDISHYVLYRQIIQIGRGRLNWAAGIQASTMSMSLNNRDGRFSPLNPLGPYYPYIQRNVQIRVSVINSASSSLATYSGYRFNGEVYVWPPQSDVTGNDVYCTISASGILTRYLQGAKVGSPIRRYYASQIGGSFAPIAAWLCDDATSAASIASMLSGGQPMTFTGKPSFMSDSSFLGSDPIAIVSGSTWHGQTGASGSPPATGSITEVTPGTYTIIAPPGVSFFTVTGTGSGGAGGDTDGTTGGSGGGGGQVTVAEINVTSGVQYTYVVPSGGQAQQGGNGGAGAAAIFTGDTQTLQAFGGKGGAYAGGAAGQGGSGSSVGDNYNGGNGGQGSISTTSNYSATLSGKAGSTGGAAGNGTAGTTQQVWVAPANVVATVTVNQAYAAGGGGAGGNGKSGANGGIGGGGGAFATGTITVHAGGSYTFNAGNGGNGGNKNSAGDSGGNTFVNGDSGSSVSAGGGQWGGAAGGGGAGGNVISGSGNSGGQGGIGANSVAGQYGGGGGSGGSNGGPNSGGANGNNANQRGPGAASGSGGRGGWGAILPPAGSGGQTNGQTGNQGAGTGGGGGAGGATSDTNTNPTGTPGGGGGPGQISWQWQIASIPTGGGGGSSAIGGVAGNNGTSGGLGGVAPTGITLPDGTFETGLNGWSATNATIAQSGTQHHSGTKSALVTVTGTPANAYSRSPGLTPVVPGESRTATCWVYTTVASQQFNATIDWFTEGGSYISTNGGAQVTVPINTWTQLTVTASAPATAGGCQYGPTVGAPAANLPWFEDDITISASSEITVGGNGGAQGMPGLTPGGGGGGGIPAIGSNNQVAPGNGAAGQMVISWNGGAVSPVPSNLVSLLLHIDPAGETDGAILFRAVTFGTINNIDLIYHTGGKLELRGWTGVTTFFDSGPISVGADGKSLAIQINLQAAGSNITWTITFLDVNQQIIVTTASGSANTITLGNVSDVYVNPTASMNGGSATSMGGIIVQNYADTLGNLSQMLDGFNGELMANRLARLCAEEGIAFVLKGNVSDTPQMGPQIDDTFLNLIQGCENADRGQVYEPREVFGIGYRTRINMQGQTPFILDYAQAMLSPPFQPVADYQLTKNDLTISRYLGASVTAQQLTGPMSTQSPPNGVGDYTYSETSYLFSDSQLTNLVAWLLILGTVSQYRYPTVNLNLARASLAALFATIASMDIGDYFQVINAPSWMTPSTIDQMTSGYTENISSTGWDFSVNAVPEDPFSTPNPPTW